MWHCLKNVCSLCDSFAIHVLLFCDYVCVVALQFIVYRLVSVSNAEQNCSVYHCHNFHKLLQSVSWGF